MVERSVWDREAEGSRPSTPTKLRENMKKINNIEEILFWGILIVAFLSLMSATINLQEKLNKCEIGKRMAEYKIARYCKGS